MSEEELKPKIEVNEETGEINLNGKTLPINHVVWIDTKEIKTKMMEQYNDRPIEDIRWTKYKIVVPTEQDKNDLEEAFYHLHDTDCDTNNIPVNQLIHEYLPMLNDDATNNIVVDRELYDKLNQNKDE